MCKSGVKLFFLMFSSSSVAFAVDRPLSDQAYANLLMDGSAEEVAAAIDAGADPSLQFFPRRRVEFRDPWRGVTMESPSALMVTILYNDLDVTRVLLEAGADVEEWLKHGRTALDLAAMTGDEERVELLLDAGADASARINANFRMHWQWSCKSAAFFAVRNEKMSGTIADMRLIAGHLTPDERWPQCGPHRK
ncbi:ankyrin repeat domain-containing protein [Natronospira bacteriovora]|uniref:Ankyrin repeat domain-containing protein n=1 Tax=Natronospira bacteriovora TaxID=3069753 RepID=A0ABU0W3R2_9GAMM|nr:ankyrin repeat domain-containing protein [Natronospira sp. AB-CW4]MDQ2068626.1 ankyrin repeat domain-containing protein [Natronospira sp. AB-CW4]